jgi:O-antigen ligase
VRDDWPHTRRPLPWLLAGFLVMVWIIPFDQIDLRIPTPVDPKFDRFALAAVIGIWLFQAFLPRRGPVTRPGRTAPALAVLAFALIAVASVSINAEQLGYLGELELAQKRLALLFAYVVFFYLVATTIRPSEVHAFGKLLIGLACVTAVGVIYEYRTGYNAFYIWSDTLFGWFANVAPSPTNINPDFTRVTRKTIVGPTQHGLALSTMFAIAMPFVVVRLLQAKTGARKVLYLLAMGLLIAAALSTARKTAAVAPIAAMVVLVAYRPRLIKWVPLALVLIVPIHFVAPGALGTLHQFDSSLAGTPSTQGRTTDYAAIKPDVLAHPVIGRGYGTIDINKTDTYRILDNEYLGQLWQVGFVGLAAYLAMIVCALAAAHRVIRGGHPVRAPWTLAAAAGCAAYGVSSATFDTLSFPHAPYMFLFVAGICAAASAAEPRGAPRRGRAMPVPLSRDPEVSPG